MIEIGQIALFLSFFVSVYSAIAFVTGKRKNNSTLLESAKNALFAVCALITIAVINLLVALLTHNFQLEYVASYSSRNTSLPYLISGLWAGNKGSLLFWLWLLSLCAAVIASRSRLKHNLLSPYSLMVIMFTEAFFLILLIFVSNPFEKLLLVPNDGNGLNPILENPGMILHPPLLLAGYVGLTVPFAFAVSALIVNKLDNEWLLLAKRWAFISWLMLGIGNLIGAWWAYVELGWGGYWAWDPVENAGLMPWLISTAFLHSTIMQKQKNIFKIWNVVLIILAFCLVMLGTFLTRSGLLSSVHTFGETGLGPFFLGYMVITFFGSLALLFYRYRQLADREQVESIVSRENTFFLNNIFFVGAAFTILIGTIFPAIFEIVQGVKIGIDASFFNNVDGPVFMAIVLLIGFCTLIGWGDRSSKKLLNKFIWPLIPTLLALIATVVIGIKQWYLLLAFSICYFAFFSVVSVWFSEVKTRHLTKHQNYLKAFWTLLISSRSHYGAYLIHISIVFIAVGILGSSFFSTENELTLAKGESVQINNYTITYIDTRHYEADSKLFLTSNMSVYNGNELIATLQPEKYFHYFYEQWVSEVAIRSTLSEDLYIILSNWNDDGSAVFKIKVNPLVIWIWIGGGIFLCGGLLVFSANPRKNFIENDS